MDATISRSPKVGPVVIIIIGVVLLGATIVALVGSAKTLSYLNTARKAAPTDAELASVDKWQIFFVIVEAIFIAGGLLLVGGAGWQLSKMV